MYHLRHATLQFDYDSICYGFNISQIGPKLGNVIGVKFAKWVPIFIVVAITSTGIEPAIFQQGKYATTRPANNCHFSTLSN